MWMYGRKYENMLKQDKIKYEKIKTVRPVVNELAFEIAVSIMLIVSVVFNIDSVYDSNIWIVAIRLIGIMTLCSILIRMLLNIRISRAYPKYIIITRDCVFISWGSKCTIIETSDVKLRNAKVNVKRRDMCYDFRCEDTEDIIILEVVDKYTILLTKEDGLEGRIKGLYI